MEELELLKKTIKTVSDDKINETISRGALRLSDEQISTVSFSFWLVYMAETDLNDVLSTAWKRAGSLFSAEVNEVANRMLQEMIKGKKELNPINLEYFSEKIKVHEAMLGKTKRTSIFWKLNDIRNDLSHNRIDRLSYNGQSLALRETKEKVLIDYFESILDNDMTKSKFWMSLAKEERDEIKRNFEKITDK